MQDTVLVTGAAGFIGMHLSEKLLAQGRTVVGIDILNDYYDVQLKYARLNRLQQHPNFHFEKLDIADYEGLTKLFAKYKFSRVANLAAQAGVRYSLTNPFAYTHSNLVGMSAILEACRQHQVEHLVYASSSSVYGGNKNIPFGEEQSVDHPVSLYAASKKANELMAHSYAHLFGLPSTGLRFFSVYGPWGRPDMASWLFTDAILRGKPLQVFAGGELSRDFTFIDDIVGGVVRLIDHIAAPNPAFDPMNPDPASSLAPHAVYNIGNNQPNTVNELIATLEELCGKKAIREDHPMQPGDVERTYANTDRLHAAVGFKPNTPLRDGMKAFVDWYRGYTGL